jgi:hypothetical protein
MFIAYIVCFIARNRAFDTIGCRKRGISVTKPDAPNVKNDARKRELAQYMADMLLEMRNMARTAGFTTLTSLFELCFCEAFSIANRVDLPEGEVEKITELSRTSRRA